MGGKRGPSDGQGDGGMGILLSLVARFLVPLMPYFRFSSLRKENVSVAVDSFCALRGLACHDGILGAICKNQRTLCLGRVIGNRHGKVVSEGTEVTSNV